MRYKYAIVIINILYEWFVWHSLSDYSSFSISEFEMLLRNQYRFGVNEHTYGVNDIVIEQNRTLRKLENSILDWTNRVVNRLIPSVAHIGDAWVNFLFYNMKEL